MHWSQIWWSAFFSNPKKATTCSQLSLHPESHRDLWGLHELTWGASGFCCTSGWCVSELTGIVVVVASCWGGKLLLNWMPSPCICGCLLFSHVYTTTTVPRKGKLLCIHHANTVNRFVVECWRRGVGCRFEQHGIVSRFYFFLSWSEEMHN